MRPTIDVARTELRPGDPEAMAHAMEADERVFLMGEDIGVYGGAFQVTGDLVAALRRGAGDRHADLRARRRRRRGRRGADRHAADLRVPVLRFRHARDGADRQPGGEDALHARRRGLGAAGRCACPPAPAPAPRRSTARASRPGSAHVPGLKVVQPSTPHDAKGMLLAAIDDPDPVMIFEHKLLYKMKGPVPEGPLHACRSARPRSAAQGRDLTIVATVDHGAQGARGGRDAGGRGHRRRGRSTCARIRPIDKQTIIASVKKTSRLLCVYEGGEDAGHRRRDQRA